MKRGFTLIELLLVMAIIGILMGMVLVYLPKAKCRASEGAAKTFISSLEQALTMYKEETGIYPPSDDDFSSKVLYSELTKPKSTEDAAPFMDFKKENLCEDKTICSRDKWPYFYRENWSKNRGKKEGLVGANAYGFDIWTLDCDYQRKEKLRVVGGCYKVSDPEELAKSTRIKNW
ncbi:MAG: type II secretion system protein [Planctomycetota bacterium]